MNPLNPPTIIVKIEKGKAEKTDFRFADSFQIGRGRESEVRIMDDIVSRPHAEIRFEEGRWWAYDLKSTNGIFVDGEKIDQVPLANNTRIILAQFGPVLSFSIEETGQENKTIVEQRSLTQYADRYFGDPDETSIGKHTMMVRRAFKKIQKKQKKRYVAIIAIFASLFLLAGTYAIYKHRQVIKQKAIAADIFYSIKRLELEFSSALKSIRLKEDAESQKLIENYRVQRKEMEDKYNQFVNTLDLYGKNISEKERLILRVARTFGECEINMPKGFAKEVMSYIKKWKTTTRLKEAIERAKKKGYIPKIVEIMEFHDLPPQFFYLALQESLFDINACGPKTRFGIAKGIWQFIPSTAVRYGLRSGPLLEVKKPDPQDERQHFEKSTMAAAKYIRDIYDTEAQASGLLVMASYNWGERRVTRLIRTMPEDPRERNFWRILEKYKEKIPKQTYDYVFYIVSATVIGENPRLFGFDFDNPLASVINKKPIG
ncbi:MAG: FHA domain-containing protein [Thermodesulfobacteriota bacterium]|nr:FHA domain-containing protein [Thermodesulfobacteriota bacterium]